MKAARERHGVDGSSAYSDLNKLTRARVVANVSLTNIPKQKAVDVACFH